MNLFDRLPPDLFRPLTGLNQRQMWALLIRLYERFFGPEALPPREEGFLQRDVTIEIERFLNEGLPWKNEDATDAEQKSHSIQANNLLDRLITTGWLKGELIGVRYFVTMHPIVMRFLETLHQFAVEGPQLIGGKVQMIYNQLRQVIEQPEAQAQGFQSAAQEAVRLINTLNATAVRVRDVLQELGKNDATQAFVQRFFADYVSTLYVRDYQQLRTENHPLKHRWEIVSIVQSLRDDDKKRTALINGYAALPRSRNEDPTEMFEADVQRFLRFMEIERYLDRLDHNINEATRRSISFLSYRLKTSDRLELRIEQSIEAVLRANQRGMPIEGRLLPPGPILSEDRLRAPVTRAKTPPKVALTRRAMTPRERAMFLLRRAMSRHRDVTPEALHRYVERSMGNRLVIDSNNLPLESVEDACAYLTLSRLALFHRATRNRRSMQHPLLRRTSVDVEFVSGERTVNFLIDGPKFTVKKRS